MILLFYGLSIFQAVRSEIVNPADQDKWRIINWVPNVPWYWLLIVALVLTLAAVLEGTYRQHRREMKTAADAHVSAVAEVQGLLTKAIEQSKRLESEIAGRDAQISRLESGLVEKDTLLLKASLQLQQKEDQLNAERDRQPDIRGEIRDWNLYPKHGPIKSSQFRPGLRLEPARGPGPFTYSSFIIMVHFVNHGAGVSLKEFGLEVADSDGKVWASAWHCEQGIIRQCDDASKTYEVLTNLNDLIGKFAEHGQSFVGCLAFKIPLEDLPEKHKLCVIVTDAFGTPHRIMGYGRVRPTNRITVIPD